MKYNPEEEMLSELEDDIPQEEDLELEEELLREIGEEDDIEEDLIIREAMHRSNAERRRMRREQQESQRKLDIYDIMDIVREFFSRYKTQFTWVVIGILLISLTVFMSKTAKIEDEPKESETQEVSEEKETEEETSTEKETLVAEAADSEIVVLMKNFYDAYFLSGEFSKIVQYIDSPSGVNSEQMQIYKMYVESVSDVVCYKLPTEDIGDYEVVLVTFKLKFYNYDELLPNVAIQFLANGDVGYKVHNVTDKEQFIAQKISQNDAHYLELAKKAVTENQSILANNSELNNVIEVFQAEIETLKAELETKPQETKPVETQTTPAQ